MGERARKPGWIGRVIAAAVVFLLIGAAVNVLVAWWPCVAIPGVDRSTAEREPVPLAHWPHVYGAFWGQPDRIVRSETWMLTRDVAVWTLEGPPDESGREPRGAAFAYLVGFPFRSLVEGMEGDYDWKQPTSQQQFHSWAFQTSWLVGRLPLRPLWPGFALNTLIYAALAWGLWRLPFAARRRRRRKRNQCIACGYSRAGLAEGSACPECGAGL